MEWTFWEFVLSGDRGVIHAWFDGMGPNVSAAAKTSLDDLLIELQHRPAAEWRRPTVAPVTGANSEQLFKFRFKTNRTAFRPIFFYGPDSREITLLAGATERDMRLHPPGVCRTSQQRKRLAEESRRCLREYFG